MGNTVCDVRFLFLDSVCIDVIRLTALKGLIIGINLIAAGAGALAIYSVMSGITVQLPSQSDVNRFLEGNDLVLLATGKVINNGYYEVEDVNVDASLWNATGDPLVSSHMHYDKIPKGTTNVEFILRFNISILAEHARMIFEDEMLTVKVSVTAEYLYKLIEFSAEYSYEDKWDQLIGTIFVDQWNITSHYWGDNMALRIPYTLYNCSYLLNGLQAGATVRLYSLSGEDIANNNTVITLTSPKTVGVFELSMDRDWTLNIVTHSQTLRLRVYGFFAGQSGYVERDIHWGAPLDGMKTNTMISPPNYIMTYSFMNNASNALDASTSLITYDANGRVTYASYDNYTVKVGQRVSRSIIVPSSAFYSAKKVAFTVMDLISKMRYMEVIEK